MPTINSGTCGHGDTYVHAIRSGLKIKYQLCCSLCQRVLKEYDMAKIVVECLEKGKLIDRR